MTAMTPDHLPVNQNDIAVTHLPGDVIVSTRAVKHAGARWNDEIINFETMVLLPEGTVEGPDTRDRDLAIGLHIAVVDALFHGAPLSSIGIVSVGITAAEAAEAAEADRDRDDVAARSDDVVTIAAREIRARWAAEAALAAARTAAELAEMRRTIETPTA